MDPNSNPPLRIDADVTCNESEAGIVSLIDARGMAAMDLTNSVSRSIRCGGIDPSNFQSRKLIDLCRDIINPYYQRRRDEAIAQIKDQMHDLPVRIHQPEGAIFLWLWFEGLPIDVQELYQRLKARNVLIIAGHHFFPGLEAEWQHKHECIRMTYSSDSESVHEGIEIIADEVRRAFEEA